MGHARVIWIMGAVGILLIVLGCSTVGGWFGLAPVTTTTLSPTTTTTQGFWGRTLNPPQNKTSLTFLYWFGAASFVGAAVVAWLLKDFRLTMILIALGIALIATGYICETYPWMMLIVFVLMLLGIIHVVYELHNSQQKDVVLGTIIKTVDGLANEKKEELTDKIKLVAGDKAERVKQTVNDFKKKLGIMK